MICFTFNYLGSLMINSKVPMAARMMLTSGVDAVVEFIARPAPTRCDLDGYREKVIILKLTNKSSVMFAAHNRGTITNCNPRLQRAIPEASLHVSCGAYKSKTIFKFSLS